MDNTLENQVKTSMNRHFDQKHIRKCAEKSALYILMGCMDLSMLDDEALTALQDTAVRLFVKYYNGRDVELLAEPYATAEVVDLILEREIPQTFPLILAVAQFVAAFEEFITTRDKEESK